MVYDVLSSLVCLLLVLLPILSVIVTCKRRKQIPKKLDNKPPEPKPITVSPAVSPPRHFTQKTVRTRHVSPAVSPPRHFTEKTYTTPAEIYGKVMRERDNEYEAYVSAGNRRSERRSDDLERYGAMTEDEIGKLPQNERIAATYARLPEVGQTVMQGLEKDSKLWNDDEWQKYLDFARRYICPKYGFHLSMPITEAERKYFYRDIWLAIWKKSDHSDPINVQKLDLKPKLEEVPCETNAPEIMQEILKMRKSMREDTSYSAPIFIRYSWIMGCSHAGKCEARSVTADEVKQWTKAIIKERKQLDAEERKMKKKVVEKQPEGKHVDNEKKDTEMMKEDKTQQVSESDKKII